MNRVTQVVVVVAVALLLPCFSYGITEAERTAQIGAALNGAFGKLPASTDPRDANVDAMIKQLRGKLELTEKESKWLDKVDAARVELDKAKAAASIPDLVMTKAAQAKEKAQQEIEALFPRLTPPANPLNVSRLQAKEKTCNKDAKQYAAMTNFLNSEPVKFLQTNSDRFLESDSKRKADILGGIAKQRKRFQAALKAEEEEDAKFEEEKQNNTFAASEFTLEKRIQGLKDTEKELKAQKRKQKLALFDSVFGEKGLINSLAENSKNLRKVREMFSGVVKTYSDYRQFSLNTGLDLNQHYVQTCSDNRDAITIGNSDLGASTPLLYTALEVVQAKNDDHYRLGFQQRATQAAQNLQCRDAKGQLEDSLGSNLQAQIDQLNTVPDAASGLKATLNMMAPLATAIGNTEGPLKDSMDDCDDSVKLKKKIENFIVREQNAAAGSSVARGGRNGQGGQRRTGSNRNRTDDNSFAGGSRRNNRNHNNSGPI